MSVASLGVRRAPVSLSIGRNAGDTDETSVRPRALLVDWDGCLAIGNRLQPGAAQMSHMRRLLESCRFQELVPAPELLAGPVGNGADHVSVARTTDRRAAIVYLPTGKPVDIHLDKLSGKSVRASWFDPRNGSMTDVGEFPTQQTRQFEPDHSGRGHDIVLVLRGEP